MLLEYKAKMSAEKDQYGRPKYIIEYTSNSTTHSLYSDRQIYLKTIYDKNHRIICKEFRNHSTAMVQEFFDIIADGRCSFITPSGIFAEDTYFLGHLIGEKILP